MDILNYNRAAWNRLVDQRNRWTIPVSSEIIEAARQGKWEIFLTPTKPVPRNWFPDSVKGVDILCLASGGGQQGPVLAAAGANVTVLDNSAQQLAQDRTVAQRDQLQLTTIEGDMADLSMFSNERFDLIFHPVSNCFVPELRPVWQEASRVLRSGGILLAGFNNPVIYIFDLDLADQGQLEVKYSLPYSDLTSLSEEQRRNYMDKGWPLEFSHSLEDQIGGQIEAGFAIVGLYEDINPEMVFAKYMPSFIATKAIKVNSPYIQDRA